jgi:hypothetical protein
MISTLILVRDATIKYENDLNLLTREETKVSAKTY